MKHAANILLFALLGFFPAALAGQGRSVLVRSGDPGVWVRWTSPDLNLREGVNIYRQEKGQSNWTKVNDRPVAFGVTGFIGVLDGDPRMREARAIVDKLRSTDKLEGMGLLLVLVRMVQSRALSQYMGVLYHDQTAEQGKTYRYEVKELNGTRESSYGQSPEVVAGNYQVGSAPSAFEAKAGKKMMRFSWDPETDRLAGAYIYYKTDLNPRWGRWSDDPVIPSKVPTSTGEEVFPKWLVTLDSVPEGRTYTFRIQGLDVFGFETEPGPEVVTEMKDQDPPPPPQELRLQVKDDLVSLDWKIKPVKDLAGFAVYRRKGSDTSWTRLRPDLLPSKTTHFEDKVDEVGLFYTYAVAAVDEAGNENRSMEKFIQVHDIIPPKPVLGFKAVPDTGLVHLSWIPNPETDLMGYQIFRITHVRDNDDLDTLRIGGFVKGTSYADTLPLALKNDLTYLVRAVDTLNNKSAFSRGVRVRLPDPVPPRAPFVKAILLDGEALRLVWLPNLEEDLAGYKVFRSLKEEAPDTAWTLLSTRMLSARDTSFADNTGEVGTSYFYRLVALDDAGNTSPWSNTYQGVVNVKKVKSGVQNLKAEYQKKKKIVQLRWENPTATPPAGYMVYRKQGNGNFLPVSGLITTTECTDPQVKPGETYYYEVRSYDKAGSSAHSKPIKLDIEQ